MIVGDYISQLSQRLAEAELCFAHGTDNPWDEACYLVFGTLSLDWADFNDNLQRAVSTDEYRLLETRARQRIEDAVPTAYLVGTAWFAGYPFRSDQRALVPRSPIAELIDNRFEPLLTDAPKRVLDLCCGGGCIGIATALTFTEAAVDLADLSPEALELAGENVQLHGLEQRVSPVSSDLFDSLAGRRYDLIVSNPPYVGAEEMDSLPQEFSHEPRMGLYSEDQGLALPTRILAQAADFLTAQGILVLEVGYSHPQLSARYPDIPFLWLEFEHGGEGVLMLTRSELLKYRERFN